MRVRAPLTFDHVFVEPHFDDVALACGGTVLALAARGEQALVVTVFAGNPGAGADVTEFAAGQHARWGGADDPIPSRGAERRRAVADWGAEGLALPSLDAISRGDQSLPDDALFGPVKPAALPLIGEIASRLAEVATANPGATWYAPLAVGNH